LTALHIESATHFLKVCQPGSRKVPVPIGPAFPRRDIDDLKDKHARLMLILFKPWRHAADLRSAGQTWREAYTEFCSVSPAAVIEPIGNIQLLHECKSSRDA
ncbi:hypothetical protein C8R45DRAFT_753955, partial [Mycena sanguinolenta]